MQALGVAQTMSVPDRAYDRLAT
jgi:hypothetical protein